MNLLKPGRRRAWATPRRTTCGTAIPAFFWNVVARYIQDGLRHLRVTEAGKQWLAQLYAHVFAVEHAQPETLASLAAVG